MQRPDALHCGARTGEMKCPGMEVRSNFPFWVKFDPVESSLVVHNPQLATMASRHSIDVFDPEVARRATQAELRANAHPKKIHEVNRIDGMKPHELSDESKAKMAAALTMELEKMKQRADERRRRVRPVRAAGVQRPLAVPGERRGREHAVPRCGGGRCRFG